MPILSSWRYVSPGFVIPARLERATHSLEGCCSIQLSYGTGKKAAANIITFSRFPTEYRAAMKVMQTSSS